MRTKTTRAIAAYAAGIGVGLYLVAGANAVAGELGRQVGAPTKVSIIERIHPDLAARRAAERRSWAWLRRASEQRWIRHHPAAVAALAPSAPPGWAEANAAVARCESGGSLTAYNPAGPYLGKWQFDIGTWRGAGGVGDPRDASEREQDYRAWVVVQRRGWAPWPVCGRQAVRVS